MNDQPNNQKGRLPANWWLPTLGGILVAVFVLTAFASCILSVVVGR